MSSVRAAESSERSVTSAPERVDPRAPRFSQAITATGLLAGALLGEPLLVFAIAAVLVTAVASEWRLDLYGLAWKRGARRIVDPPAEFESAVPHRFAKLLGAVGTTLASLALLAGFYAVGYALAVAVGLLAALGATTGLCLGCKLYRQVSYFQRLGVL